MTTQTILEHKKCICVEFGDTNNNKVWQMTIFDDGTALTEWGRVGKKLQNKMTSKIKAYKKWSEKTNQNNKPDKRYTEVRSVDTGGSSTTTETVKNAELKDVARKQIKHSDPTTQELIDYCIAVNAHSIMKQSGGKIMWDASSAAFKTPLGVINPMDVADARNLLVDMADWVQVNNYGNKGFSTALNKYLRLIPHDVGMKKISPQLIFPDFQAVQHENDLLDGLESSFASATTAPKKKTKKKKDDTPQVFNVELKLVEDNKIISRIKKKYQSTRKAMHQSNSLSVKRVYSINIAMMAAAYAKHGAKMKDIRELWHGTKASNLLSILKGGLIIPPFSSSHCTGRMYGNGIYASSVSTKALNYATNFWGSGGDSSRTFMFLLDMAMGTYYEALDWGGTFPKRNTDSTWAKAGRALKNDEMIAYRLDQVNLTYLVEFCPRNSY